MNENNIPKRKRSLFIYDLKDITNKLVDSIDKANRCYPNSKARLMERKGLLSLSIESCMDLYHEFQFIDDVQHLNMDRLSQIMDLLLSTTQSLKKLKTSNKVISEEDSDKDDSSVKIIEHLTLKKVRCFFVS